MAILKGKNPDKGSLQDLTSTTIDGGDDPNREALDVNIKNPTDIEVGVDFPTGDDALATSSNQIPPTDLLKADQTAATSDTNVVTVTQAGIKDFKLFNPSPSITMYVWFGADPSASNQIVLPPNVGYDDTLKTAKGDMRYKSASAGGYLIYVLKG